MTKMEIIIAARKIQEATTVNNYRKKSPVTVIKFIYLCLTLLKIFFLNIFAIFQFSEFGNNNYKLKSRKNVFEWIIRD